MITCCQTNIVWEDKARNFARVDEMLAGEKSQLAGRLVLLPEMFATGFSMNVEGIAEPEGGETEAFLKATARKNACTLVGGLVRKGPEGMGRNHALVASPEGEILADYAKMHPFTYGEESRHYLGGAETRTFNWAGITVGLAICYDLRFPELFRALARKGAQVLLVIANWPSPRTEHSRTLLIARAIENQCYVAGCNRTGSDPKNQYAGGSIIIGPRGNVLAEAGPEEKLIAAPINAPELQKYRTDFPALRDMKDQFFAG